VRPMRATFRGTSAKVLRSPFLGHRRGRSGYAHCHHRRSLATNPARRPAILFGLACVPSRVLAAPPAVVPRPLLFASRLCRPVFAWRATTSFAPGTKRSHYCVPSWWELHDADEFAAARTGNVQSNCHRFDCELHRNVLHNTKLDQRRRLPGARCSNGGHARIGCRHELGSSIADGPDFERGDCCCCCRRAVVVGMFCLFVCLQHCDSVFVCLLVCLFVGNNLDQA
jgi:hypothetical protein